MSNSIKEFTIFIHNKYEIQSFLTYKSDQSKLKNKTLNFNLRNMIKIIYLLIFNLLYGSINCSTDVNNTNHISDIYMENILLKSKIKNINDHLKLSTFRLNKITYEGISNYKKNIKEKEEVLMNYYSEHTNLIKDILFESIEEKNKKFILPPENVHKNFFINNVEKNKIFFENPSQLTSKEMECIFFSKGCGSENVLKNDRKNFIFKKGLSTKNNGEIKNVFFGNQNYQFDKIPLKINIKNLNYFMETKKNSNMNDNSSPNTKNKNIFDYIFNDKDMKAEIEEEEKINKIRNINLNEKLNLNKNHDFNQYNIKNDNFDLYNEIFSELFKDKLDNKKFFEFNLKSLYGNSTIFNFNIEDLENLIKNNYLTDGQAVLLWETLAIKKTDRLKNLNIQIGIEASEIFMIPIKKIILFIINTAFCTLVYNLLISYNSKEKDYSSYLVNIIVIGLSLYSTEFLYYWRYYLASSEMLLLFIFALKIFCESIYNKLGFVVEDYNIFNNYSKTKNATQFILKILLLFSCTLFLGIFTFTKFPHLYNYILFYYCIHQILNLVSVYFQYEMPAIFQPFRHFTMLCFGFLNFLILNFHNENYFSCEFISFRRSDSFYLIGDIYTIFCFSFFYDFLFTQANNISNLFFERNLDNEKINSHISVIMKEQKQMKRDFTAEDSLWILGFLVGFLFQYVGLNSNKYLIFYFSLYYFKNIISIFGRVYNIKCLRLIYNSFLFVFLSTNHIISSKNDDILFQVKINFHKFLYLNILSILII